MATIRVSDDVKRQLEHRSEITGISEYDLANTYLSNAMIEESVYNESLSPEEIDKLLDHDLPEGDWVSKKLIGLAEFDNVTNAVSLKKKSFKRGKLP